MRTCPVCEAKSFDDMEICFGCMHRFSEPTEADFVQDAHAPIVLPKVEAAGCASAALTASAAGQAAPGSDAAACVLANPDPAPCTPVSPEPVACTHAGPEPVAYASADSEPAVCMLAGQGANAGGDAAAILPVMDSGYKLVISLQPA